MFTAADLQTIKTAIQADATMSADWSAGNPGAVAAYLNAVPSSGPVSILRPDVTTQELAQALDITELLALTQTQLSVLQLAGLARTLDFTNANVTAGLAAVFPSTTTTYTNLMAVAQRAATRLEALFSANSVCAQYGAQIDASTVILAMKS